MFEFPKTLNAKRGALLYECSPTLDLILLLAACSCLEFVTCGLFVQTLAEGALTIVLSSSVSATQIEVTVNQTLGRNDIVW